MPDPRLGSLQRLTALVVIVFLNPGCGGASDPEEAESSDSRLAEAHAAGDAAAAAVRRRNDLKQIGIGLHTYAASAGGTLIPRRKEGALSTWRVGILESIFAGQVCDDEGGKTRCLLVTGPGTLVENDDDPLTLSELMNGGKPPAEQPIIVVVGEDEAVPCREPGDFVLDRDNPRAGLGTIGEEGFEVLMGVGNVVTIPADASDAALLWMFSAGGGDDPKADDYRAELFGAE